MNRSRFAAAVGLASLVLLSPGQAHARPDPVDLPPSPYAILGSELLDPPPLDAIAVCVPTRISQNLDDFSQAMGERDFGAATSAVRRYARSIQIQAVDEHESDVALLEAVLGARSAERRSQKLEAIAKLEAITKKDRDSERLSCGLIESARLLLRLGRLPEAQAATKRVVKQNAWLGDDHPFMLAARFYDAEILYARDDHFNAHIAYRDIASSGHPRIAAAARLRLTDLSFDAGKSRPVQLEYETLLPHGQAFGARMADWALRASEAALDAGDYAAARAWFERHAEEVDDRDARDVAEVRRADLDVLEGKPDKAFKRLRSLFGRKGRSEIEALARVRSVDLGVSSASPDDRVAQLHDATATTNPRVRVYALSVLVHELLLLGRLDEAIAAVTRLAYEGADPVLARRFPEDVSAILAKVAADASDREGCRRMIRRMGGRYAILLDHATAAQPFLTLGRCFEELGFHELAVSLYRALPRTFGRAAARAVALPLARTSLAAGEPAMARAAAEVNLRNPDLDPRPWRALLARAYAALGHRDKAREVLRKVLAEGGVAGERVELVGLFAELLEGRPFGSDTRLLIEQLEKLPQRDRAAESSAFGEASMKAAHLLRRQGRLETAVRFYRAAAEHLPDGARRRESRFWAGDAEAVADSDAGDAPGDAGDAAIINAWSRLSRYDQKAQEMAAKHALPGGSK